MMDIIHNLSNQNYKDIRQKKNKKKNIYLCIAKLLKGNVGSFTSCSTLCRLQANNKNRKVPTAEALANTQFYKNVPGTSINVMDILRTPMLRSVLSGSTPSRQHLPEREGRLTETEVLQHIIYITH